MDLVEYVDLLTLSRCHISSHASRCFDVTRDFWTDDLMMINLFPGVALVIGAASGTSLLNSLSLDSDVHKASDKQQPYRLFQKDVGRS